MEGEARASLSIVSTKRRLYLPKLRLRLGGGALFAVALQLVAIFAPIGDDIPRRVLLLLSYTVLLAFVYLNLKRIGIAIIGVGLLLNFLPIVANGGLMPVTPETLARGDFPEDVEVGEWVSGSKDVLLERDDIRLWALGDRFVLDDFLGGTIAYSVGDIILLAGLIVFLSELLVPRMTRVPKDDDDGEGAV